MNAITYHPGNSLNQLKNATLSAPYTEWEDSFRINVLGPYFLTAELIDLLGAAAAKGEGRGSVLIFSSPASIHTNQFVPCYQTSKAAVDHLVRIMAAEFADFYSKSLRNKDLNILKPNFSSRQRIFSRSCSFWHDNK